MASSFAGLPSFAVLLYNSASLAEDVRHMPKQQSRRIAARHHELARRKKARQHGDASAVAGPAAPVATAAAPTPAPATIPASAPAKKSAPLPVTKGPRQILTPDVRHLKSDFLTLALLTSIVAVVMVVLKVMEGQGILLR